MIRDKLKDDGNFIIFMGHYMEFYIPETYFQSKLGSIYGSDVKCFGIFNCREFDTKMKPQKLETFNYPTMIILHPSSMSKQTINLDGDDTTYIVCKFFKGDKIMRNESHIESTNVELFVDMVLKGKLPGTIPYKELIHIWLKNLEINSIKLGVSSIVLEAILSEFYRDKKNPTKRFGITKGKNPSVSETDYKAAGIREVCSRNSTFSALTFEDMDSMITTSININKYGKEEKESPLEKIMKM